MNPASFFIDFKDANFIFISSRVLSRISDPEIRMDPHCFWKLDPDPETRMDPRIKVKIQKL
jgi:hypothetical protein